MTKRELNYILLRNPKKAFRLIEPSSCIRVAVRYGRNNRSKSRKANELIYDGTKINHILSKLSNKHFDYNLFDDNYKDLF